MFQTIKRHVSLFILVAVASAVPVLANTEKAGKNKTTENVVINLEGNKNVALGKKIVFSKENHSYRLNLKPGERVVVTVRSNRPTSLKVQSSTGIIEHGRNATEHKATLTGAGEYDLEISTEGFSLYTIDVVSR